jgi:hypothetical protein
MASAGTVTLNLDANSVKLMRELQKAQRTTRTSSSAMAADFQRAFSRIAKASAVAVTAVAGALTAVYRSQSRVIDELGKSSDALGVQTEKLQALRHIGNLTGLSTEGLTTNLQRMQRSLGQIARQGGPAEKALQDIGINIQDIINLSADRQLEEISKAMAGVENSALRASIASDLFGRDGARMLNLMNQLKRDGLDPVVESMDQLGLSMTRIDVARLERANDAMYEARQVFTGVFQRLTVNMSDFVAHFATAFTDMAKNSDMLGAHVDDMFDRIILGSIDVFEAVGRTVSPILSIMKSLWDSYMKLPQFARELGIIGALLFGRVGLAAVLVGTGAIRGFQTAIDSMAESLRNIPGAEGSQLQGLAAFFSGDNDASLLDATAGLFSPDFENTVSQQASWLREQQAKVMQSKNDFVRDYEAVTTGGIINLDPMWDDPGIDDLLDGIEEVNDSLTQMQKFGQQAAVNLQNHFAQFLFDPFKDGLRGMAKGFIDTIRQMMAQAAAAKILTALLGGFAGSANPLLAGIGAVFKDSKIPSMDSGGRGSAGKAYMIGKGAQPEMFIPDSAGTFVPNADKMGGTSFAITIDARDPGAEGRIRTMIEQEMAPQIIEAAQGRTIASMRRPRFA